MSYLEAGEFGVIVNYLILIFCNYLYDFIVSFIIIARQMIYSSPASVITYL